MLAYGMFAIIGSRNGDKSILRLMILAMQIVISLNQCALAEGGTLWHVCTYAFEAGEPLPRSQWMEGQSASPVDQRRWTSLELWG